LTAASPDSPVRGAADGLSEPAGRRVLSGQQHLARVRFWLGLFVAGLVLAGVSAIPLAFETRLVVQWLDGPGSGIARSLPALAAWLRLAHQGLASSYARFPFLAYGTDWLAFGHLMIAVAFIGPIRDPVRNKWVVQFGMIACLLVLPFAAIAGLLRHIPALWTPIDMSFGVIGLVPLLLAYRHVRVLERFATAGTLSESQIRITSLGISVAGR
jgi:hypothetical protein